MMNSKTSTINPPRRNALLWLLICLLMLGVLCIRWPTAQINSSVLALLPQDSIGDIPPALKDGFIQRLDRQLVWLVSPGNTADPQVADYWQHLLQQQPDLHQVTGQVNAKAQQVWGEFYFRHRNGSVDPLTRSRLQQGGTSHANWVLGQLYSAFSGVSSNELKHDPLMLVRGSQLALAQQASKLRLMQNWLVTQDNNGRYWYLLYGELNGSSFDMQKTQQLVNALHKLEHQLQEKYPNSQVLSRGTLFYSEYAGRQAKDDISTLGAATIFGVILLILAIFRSLQPLLLCLLSIFTGALAGTAITLLVFGQLHMMTLVMSVSIIGISADYTLYYLTERMVHGVEDSPWQSLFKVRNSLLLALVTTVLAWLIMMLAPFPGIRQMALFSIVGLTASCLTVLYWQPWLCRNLPVRPVPAALHMLRWLAAWRRNKALYIGLPALVGLLSVVGLTQLQVNDDISQLQSLPQDILSQEKAITALTGQRMDQKWFVVYGSTPQETLERLEAFTLTLDNLQHDGLITHYRQIPLNSLKRQQNDLALIQKAAPAVIQALNQTGLKDTQIDTKPMPVMPETWLTSSVSDGWRLMWLTLADGQTAILVPVEGVRDSAVMDRTAQQATGVAWVDRKTSFDHLFSLYRMVLSVLLIVALGIITISAIYRRGWQKGLTSLVPSVLSLIFPLAVLALNGYPINLFSMLALVLVLGIGINYTIFFSNPRGTPLTSLLAIILAMTTSLLTLGMLVFSSTQAISGFGIVLCSGIFIAFLLSPLAMPDKKERKK